MGDAKRERLIELHDEALRLAPEGANHDSSVCPLCVDQAQKTGSETPPGLAGSESAENKPTPHATEGGTSKHMTDTLTKETHEALLDKAVRDALAKQSAELETAQAQVTSLTAERDEAAAKVTDLEADNARLNGELDTAQVELKSAKDEVATLKGEIAQRDTAAQVAKVATERASQVKGLGLFPDEYISDKASAWAAMDEAAWNERVEEWTNVKSQTPSTGPSGATSTDTAMSNSASAPTPKDTGKSSAKRAVLGLAG